MSEDRQADVDVTWTDARKAFAFGTLILACLVGAAVVQWSSPGDGTGYDPPGCQASSPEAEFDADAVYLNETHTQTRLTHVAGDSIPTH